MVNPESGTVAKLAAIREVKSKTVILKKSRHQLESEIEDFLAEDTLLNELRAEKIALAAEKEKKLLELRQIETDINTLEIVITESSSSRSQSIDRTKITFSRFCEVKRHVDGLRENVLELPKVEPLRSTLIDQLESFGIQEKIKKESRKRKFAKVS